MKGRAPTSMTRKIIFMFLVVEVCTWVVESTPVCRRRRHGGKSSQWTLPTRLRSTPSRRWRTEGTHLEGSEGEGGTRHGEEVVRVGLCQVGDPAKALGLHAEQARVGESAQGKEHAREDGGLREREDEVAERVDVVLLHERLRLHLGGLHRVEVAASLCVLELVHALEHLGLDDGEAGGVALGADLEREQEQPEEEGDDGDEERPLEARMAEERERLVQVEEEGLEAHDRVRTERARERRQVERPGDDPVVDVLDPACRAFLRRGGCRGRRVKGSDLRCGRRLCDGRGRVDGLGDEGRRGRGSGSGSSSLGWRLGRRLLVAAAETERREPG